MPRDLHERVAVHSREIEKSLNATLVELIDRGLEADRPMIDTFGSLEMFRFMRALGAAADLMANGAWLEDQRSYDEVAQAIRNMLAVLRPNSALSNVVAELRGITAAP